MDYLEAAMKRKVRGYAVQDMLPLVLVIVLVGVLLAFGSVFLATLQAQAVVNGSADAVANIGYGQDALGAIGGFLGIIILAVVFGIALGALMGMFGGMGGMGGRRQ